nr:UbiD family decarboxylase [uncultured Holophaga sp.]
MSTQPAINDLRSALKFLEGIPGQLVCTDVEVDPIAELSGVYRYIGAGGTTERPTKLGPTMIFNKIKGFEQGRVNIGMLADRKRVAMMLGTTVDRLGFKMADALKSPIDPVFVSKEQAPSQEVVHLATDPGFDIRKLLPAPTNTPVDAGPFITMGLCCASDPETGETDVTIHRLCLQGPDTLSMFISMGRHLGTFRDKYEKEGKAMPITINIGLDPAVYIAACFEAPSTPLGFNELSIAGGIRQEAVQLAKALTIDGKSLARAEIVIEGELLPNVRVVEDQNSHTGRAMPEFPGYNGPANPSLPIIKVKAVTTRRNPIMQTCIGCSEEHVNLAGIPTEASIIQLIGKAIPGFLQNVYAASPGGGKLMAVLQVKKRTPADEGRQGQAALLAFSAFCELKNVILVDEDVDPFDMNDVIWAMTTRYQGNLDTTFLPNIRSHQLDPSQDPAYNNAIRARGLACKTIFDCTVPYGIKEEFKRAPFKEVPDYEKWLEPSTRPLEL